MKHIRLNRKVSVLFISLLLCFGCSLQKQIPEDKILIKKTDIIGAPPDYKHNLNALIIERPRRRMLGLSNPFLFVHMKYEKKKQNSFNRTIKRVFGEKPVFADSLIMNESAKQMSEFLVNKGYFRSSVGFEIKHRNNKGRITYFINHGERFTINDVSSKIADEHLEKVLRLKLKHSEIQQSDYYDSDKLIKEREQISFYLNNRGYFKFNKFFVYFDVDTSLALKNMVNVQTVVRNFSDTSNHRPYRIKDVFVEANYNFLDTVAKDTFIVDGLKFIGSDYVIKPQIFSKNLTVKNGDIYSLEKQRQTINNIAELQVFKFIDVDFRELPSHIHTPDELLTIGIPLSVKALANCGAFNSCIYCVGSKSSSPIFLALPKK